MTFDVAKSKFIEAYSFNIQREGSEALFDYICNSDFFEAPASTRFHLCEPGGLCVHSLHVWSELNGLLKFYNEMRKPPNSFDYSTETIAICGLLHDLCKINTYSVDYRNKKNDVGEWEKVPVYVREEKEPYGNHGAKSVFTIMQYMKLSQEEASAIQCHMGNEDGKYATSDVYATNPLAWFLHVADEAATYLDE